MNQETDIQSEQLEQGVRAIHEIAARNQSSDRLELPSLTVEGASENTLVQTIREMFGSLAKWVSSYFESSKSPVSPATIEAVFTAAVGVLAVCLISIVGYMIFKAMKKRRALQDRNFSPLSNLASIPDDRLGEGIQTALSEKNYSLASRLRWRLFLVRSKSRSSLTPREYLASHEVDPSFEPLAYDLMFGSARVGLEAYQALHQGLLQREPQA